MDVKLFYILPVYGRYDLVEKWILNMFKQDVNNFNIEFLIVDDATPKEYKIKDLKDIFLIFSSKYKTLFIEKSNNGGYTAAVNNALKYRNNADLIVFGNTDAIYNNTYALKHQWAAMQITGADICGIRTTQKEFIHHDGILPTKKMPHINFMKKIKDTKKGIPEVDLVTGCGMMVTKKVIDYAKNLHNYNGYGWQDVDLCARWRNNGGMVICDRQVSMEHAAGSSQRLKDNADFLNIFNKNRNLFFQKFPNMLQCEDGETNTTTS